MADNGIGSDVSSVLAQMRELRAQASRNLEIQRFEPDVAVNDSVRRTEFSNLLSQALNSVNDLQQAAGQSADDFVAGKETDLVKVMVDGQKAQVGFQALLQVRNRMVSAYQDILNMPI